MPSPPAAGVPAATVFAFPAGFSGPWEAAAVLTIVIVPALLMVSTIRFQSFKTFDLGMPGGYRLLLVFAAFIGLLVTYPHEVLILIAYTYFGSGFVGTLMTKLGRRPEGTVERPAVEPAADAPAARERKGAV